MSCYTRQYTGIYCTSLTAEMRKRTCDYWYVVEADGYAHTAFRTRAALLTWLNALGLKLAGELPEQGQHADLNIEGTYKRGVVICDRDGWDAIPGVSVTVLENGRYLPGKLADAEDGTRILYVSNVNNKWNVEVDYRLASKLHDAGLMVL